MPARETDIESY